MAGLTRAKAIREKCIDCCGGSLYEPRKCEITNCPLWEFRTGRKTPHENAIAANPSTDTKKG